MNFQFYLEKLKDSESFKRFARENPDAFLCSGFFVVDKKNGNSQQHIDYFLPSSKELLSFCISEACQKNPADIVNKEQKFEQVSENLDFDFSVLEKLIFDEMEKREIKKEVEKMLFSLQAKDGKQVVIATVFISTLGLITATIDLEKMEIENFEKKSFFDLVNVFKK